MPDQWHDLIVVRVVDGDTLLGDVALGLNVWLRSIRFRLARINAPEMSTPAGQPAKDYLAALLLSGPLLLSSQRQDDYGRWLAEIRAGPSGANVSDVMLASGHAVPWPAPKPSPAP